MKLPNQKGFAPIILLIIAGVVVLALFIFVAVPLLSVNPQKILEKAKVTNSVNPSSTNSQSSSVTDPTKDWFVYESSYYTIKYPKEWKSVFPGGNPEQTDGPMLTLQSPCDRAASERCWEVDVDASWLKAFSNLESPILNENLIQTKDVIISGQTAKEYIYSEPSSLCQGKFANSANDYGDYGCVSDLYVVNYKNKGFTIELKETVRKTSIKSIEDWKDKKTLDAILSTLKFK